MSRNHRDPVPGSDITLHEALQEYLEHLKAEGKSDRTIYTYGKDAQQIEAFFGPGKKLSAILIPRVASFLKSDALLRLPNGNERMGATVQKTVRVFRMFMIWAIGRKYIASLPFPKDLPLGHSAKRKEEAQDAGIDSAVSDCISE